MASLIIAVLMIFVGVFSDPVVAAVESSSWGAIKQRLSEDSEFSESEELEPAAKRFSWPFRPDSPPKRIRTRSWVSSGIVFSNPAAGTKEVLISIPNIAAPVGTVVDVPVKVEKLDGRLLKAYAVSVVYDYSVLVPMEFIRNEDIEGAVANDFRFKGEDVWKIFASPFSGTSQNITLFTLRFWVREDAPAKVTQLTIKDPVLNDGDNNHYSVARHNGGVAVERPIELHSVKLGADVVEFKYSNSTGYSLHLYEEGGASIPPINNGGNQVSLNGEDVVSTFSSAFYDIFPGQSIKVCHGNNGNMCSFPVVVEDVGKDEWQLQIQVAGREGDVRTIGQALGATDGLDFGSSGSPEAHDLEYPPPPPFSFQDAVLVMDGIRLMRDIRSLEPEKLEFWIDLEHGDEVFTSLRWDPSQLPTDAVGWLETITGGRLGDIDGGSINVGNAFPALRIVIVRNAR